MERMKGRAFHKGQIVDIGVPADAQGTGPRITQQYTIINHPVGRYATVARFKGGYQLFPQAVVYMGRGFTLSLVPPHPLECEYTCRHCGAHINEQCAANHPECPRSIEGGQS